MDPHRDLGPFFIAFGTFYVIDTLTFSSYTRGLCLRRSNLHGSRPTLAPVAGPPRSLKRKWGAQLQAHIVILGSQYPQLVLVL